MSDGLFLVLIGLVGFVAYFAMMPFMRWRWRREFARR